MPHVFISYSHEDSAALDRLRVHLKPLVDRGLVDFWDDTRIAPGAAWGGEIERVIERADVAVLVVSAEFLASDFITKHELPRILERHLRNEIELLPIFWSVSNVAHLPYTVPGSATPLKLSEIQGFGTPDRPLATWNKSDCEREFVRLARHILARADVPTKLPVPAARRPAATTTGEAVRRDYELVVRLDRKADGVEIRYEHPDTGALGVKPQRADLRAAQEISRDLAVARTDVLEARLARATSDWGPELLKLLFPQLDLILRAVYERGANYPQPTPAYGAVRVWIVTDDAMLVGLPWRLTAWDGRLLLDLDWTLAVTRNPKPSRHVTTRPPESALIIAPRAGATDGAAADAFADALKLAWGRASRPYVVTTRSEVQNALDGGLRPHIVFVHGRVAMRAGRAALLLDGASGEEPLPIAHLARLLQGEDAAAAPAVIYLDVVRDEVEATGFEPLLPLSPLVVWRGVPHAMSDSTSRAVVWLRRWLTESDEGDNPVRAWRDAHWEDATKAVEAATVVLHGDFRTWRTERARVATQSQEARLVLDRRRPKAAIAADVRELMQRDDRRVLAFVACAARGNLIARFGEQLELYLQADIGAQTPLRRVVLQLPPEREALYELLARELRLQLNASSSEPLNMLLQRTAPKRGSKGRPLLWLDWGVCGESHQRLLTERQLGEWARFGAEFLASQSPADVRVLTSVHLELKSQDTCKRILGILQWLRGNEPWYTHASPAYRLAELDPLDVVTENEVLEFLGTQADCNRSLRPELARLIHRETNGHFDRTVELLEEGQKGSWYALAARLRGSHAPLDRSAADEELE